MRKFHASIRNAELSIAKYALALLSFLVFAAAVARTVGHPIGWAIDVATFLFAWCVNLGGDVAIREDKLFAIVLVTARLPSKAQHVLNVINYAIIAIFLVTMIGYGAWLSYITRVRPFQGIPGFSYTWVTISVPIGCALMLLSAVQKIRLFVKAIRDGTPIRKEEGPAEVIRLPLRTPSAERDPIMTIVLILFLMFMLMGMPVAFALGISGVVFFLQEPSLPMRGCSPECWDRA